MKEAEFRGAGLQLPGPTVTGPCAFTFSQEPRTQS